MIKMRSAVFILTLALAGCGFGRVPAPPTVFDLGLDAAPVPALPSLTFQPSSLSGSGAWLVSPPMPPPPPMDCATTP